MPLTRPLLKKIVGFPKIIKTANLEHMVDEMETLGGSIEDIRALCAVVELGTVSAAARQLGETKGGISRRISRLEQRLGATLLARTPRAVTPTEEGLAFHAKAREGLTLLEDAAEGARRSRALPRGHLRITAPHDLGLEILPALLADFRRAHSQISIELLLSETTLDLAAHRIDLALRVTASALPDMGYRASPLVDLTVRLYASANYLSSRPAPSQPADLSDHDFITTRVFSPVTPSIELVNQRAQKQRIPIKAAVETGDFATVHRLLLAGGGIGALPDLVAEKSLGNGELVPILPDWWLGQARLHVITLAGHQAPARVRVFREFMRNRLAGMRTSSG